MQTVKSILEQLNHDGGLVSTSFDTGIGYTGVQVVHAPYVIIKDVPIKGRNPDDFIVAKWLAESPEFFREFFSDFQKYPLRNIFEGASGVLGKGCGSRGYNPFEEKFILSTILNMDPFNTDEVLTFCNKFGILGDTSSLSTVSPALATLYQHVGGVFESREFFIESVMTIQEFIKNYSLLQEIKAGAILTEQEQFEVWERIVPGYWEIRKDHIQISIEELLQGTIKSIINGHLQPVSAYVEVSKKDGRFYPGYSTRSLSGAIWFQIYDLITRRPEGQVFKKCLYCHEVFVAKSDREKYCPDPQGFTSHSPCENKYNAMKHRARKWYKNNLKTIDDIAAQLNRPVSEIDSWMSGL